MKSVGEIMSEVQKKSNGKEENNPLSIMRKPFADHQISKMCRPTKKDNQPGTCKICGGWHKLPSIQILYVGHAALTDRLLDADPLWTWEPLAFAPDGTPLLDTDGGMWIKLTVGGVTRLGYGDAQGKTGGDATKERIGDALRNAAMRFGAALELWHKGDLHGDSEEPEVTAKPNGKEVAAAILAPPKAEPEPTKQKVDGWKLDGDILQCFVYEASPLRKSQKGTEFVAVKHNGKVNGKDIAFCYSAHLFEALWNCKDHFCAFYVSPGAYVKIEDVLEISGQKYKEGKPIAGPAEIEVLF